MGILELTNTTCKIKKKKNSMHGLKSRMEIIEKKSVNLKIEEYKLSNLKNREKMRGKKERVSVTWVTIQTI